VDLHAQAAQRFDVDRSDETGADHRRANFSDFFHAPHPDPLP
jgi:hypothetical protein